jgi:hypothetical protein
MKQLTYVILAVLLISIFGCRRNRAERQYERFLEDSDRIEFITPPEDTVKLDDVAGEEDWMEDEGELITIPDIPQERPVNMGASDYELKKAMSGRAD